MERDIHITITLDISYIQEIMDIFIAFVIKNLHFTVLKFIVVIGFGYIGVVIIVASNSSFNLNINFAFNNFNRKSKPD